MDGMQATQAIRQNFASPVAEVPVIALTASANPVDRARCLSAGMNDVLLKPLEERELIAKISKALASRAAGGQP
jgi:CheY-like chemotaxis protein